MSKQKWIEKMLTKYGEHIISEVLYFSEEDSLDEIYDTRQKELFENYCELYKEGLEYANNGCRKDYKTA